MTVRLSQPKASCKRTATVSSSLKRRLVPLSEVPFDIISYFTFLCLFHTFLF
ncbi:hypothetical protein MTR_4g451335 [Medicago truncatula]|uniref:Uncharacterized protein n=1 Tax=Medicago truncatula TaxID=3880 RepID=G8A314_MEDTR|nr:hypothetical protein MTR_4g451335 [Medicago truncatula]